MSGIGVVCVWFTHYMGKAGIFQVWNRIGGRSCVFELSQACPPGGSIDLLDGFTDHAHFLEAELFGEIRYVWDGASLLRLIVADKDSLSINCCFFGNRAPMRPFVATSTAKQLCAHLREEIQAGRLAGTMPGVNQLVQQLGMGTRTVIGAIQLLESEGWVEKAGNRRPRIIVRDSEKTRSTKKRLRIQILLYESDDFVDPYFNNLRHHLEQAGHDPVFHHQTLVELEMSAKRVKRLIQSTPADAWIVVAGSREVLETFRRSQIPSYALFGRQTQVQMAGLVILKTPALAKAIGHLVDMGHRRIVLMTREERRKPKPGVLENNFLLELEANGIQTGAYHLPDWEESTEGFHAKLSSLFRVTPPTAMVFSEPKFFFAAQQFFLKRKISVPGDVSLLVLDEHPAYSWFESGVSQISSNSQSWIKPVLHWVKNLADGVSHERKTIIKARFVVGGTTGPARRV
ncbi:MAG: substrate-binding domain-containing protein [Luteolibacter sp.]